MNDTFLNGAPREIAGYPPFTRPRGKGVAMSSNVRPVAVATLAFAVFSGSQIQAAEPNTGGRAGVPQDWSQRALVYTNPSIPDDAGLVAGAQPR